MLKYNLAFKKYFNMNTFSISDYCLFGKPVII